MKELAERLTRTHRLDAAGYRTLLAECDDPTLGFLRHEAVRTACEQFGRGIYVRGLVEVGSVCRNDCLYCGLRRSNTRAERYRLSDEQILECCREGYAAGFRTFVLQGGEDAVWTDARLTRLIGQIKRECEGAAVTLSLGERSRESYEVLRQAGADRYLLRHEAADRTLYESLHPSEMSWERRLRCIADLKELGFQTGVGMMVGVPGQTVESLVEDLLFMERVNPEMIGIGPFIPHRDTPLGEHSAGSLRMTLLLVAVVRLMFPRTLIPATTALATLAPNGRREGILSGANVVMPNLSPRSVRSKYAIYEGKASSGSEAAEGLAQLEKELNEIGYHVDYARGDFKR
ncbi:MAG: [FeFe] hydrogenase H-cluster radical SAM maturase HydE [Rikenellaceae bacterium]|nr:[FeFe] hydrogenase H-cluster radical SAM maturase HydE [Rikenellaceae bacterium]